MEQSLLEFTKKLAEEAGALIRERMAERGTVEQKTNVSDLVTEVDKASERLIMSRIAEAYPDHWILSEESNGQENSYAAFQSRGSGYGWIIDPIDGTTNFIHGLPHFAVSIGIVKDKEPLIGVVYNPLTRELFSALKGHGAYLNGRAIEVSEEKTVAEALLATGFYAGDWREASPVLPQVDLMVGRCRNLRMIGAASLDLCWVAAGRLTGYWHRGLHPWDAAAGLVIVREAGGTVTDGQGEDYYLTQFTIAATNSWIHDELIALTN
ncbi:inositol monophosphatase family protein [Paenibacillus abyssi]|uniref:Inositol-1-monophosphatase n=1 Tax=Paenibacillus abyssi TaxID=1340531 RepID=A0A917FW77_9BACL|nr:inositol monophosphatase family protein [Paenibacillus abyssi]GGG10780.1 inositol monophosphatase [Paenibacillus abyssi]